MGKDDQSPNLWERLLWGSKPVNGTQNGDKCPVDHGQKQVKDAQTFPVPHDSMSTSGQGGCPVDPETQKIWLMKNGGNVPGQHIQTKSQDVECSSAEISDHPVYKTSSNLPDSREVSSIPRTETGNNWVYPSEKQFYEAMVRKNWSPDEKDMQTVVPIHNSVNERVWSFIKNWEEGQGGDQCGGIKLTSFKGDSKKLTPRAWVRSSILGYSKPFDRHDWTVNRCGKELDYVIDFYSNDASESGAPDIYMDVRPKLNSIEGFRLRIAKSFGW